MTPGANPWSAELRLLLQSEAGYRRLTGGEPHRPRWAARPALVLLTIGAMISILTAGRLALPLVIEACLAWSFVPALHIAAAAAIARWGPGRRHSFGRTVDLYFMGFGPWLLWMMGLSGAALFLPSADPVWRIGQAWFLGGAVLAFAWSARVNLGFFRGALGLSLPRALLAVVAVRAWTWGFFLAYLHLSDQLLPRIPRLAFVGPALGAGLGTALRSVAGSLMWPG